jgi:hypothetical protein
MKWKHPPPIKIYEALGAVADNRVEVSGNTGKVFSSTGSKFYTVSYDPESKSIMANDNGSYWKGYLGYPAIAFLMKISVLSYDIKIANLLKNIAWKDINQKFKNNFYKALEFILASKTKDERNKLEQFVSKVNNEIEKLDLKLLGKKVKPPEGY